jgi:aminoglycoside phosphotransferase family enzyme/predicted kinase
MNSLKQDFVAQGMQLRETHISEVFLTRENVYKVKKPVQLGFLDFSTLERRKAFCEAEVKLNRRLAPSVYRGVVPVTQRGKGPHKLGGEGPIVDYAVEMKRLPDSDAADVRLRNGRLERGDLQRIAVQLADFHRRARCDEETSRFGTPEAIASNVIENFEQTRSSAPRFLPAAELEALERWQREFLERERPRFEARIAAQRVRDGHGDLRLEHCYLDATGGVEIIDCIEFNERFRYGDVCADLAFLAMDLTWHERPDLSEALLAFYASLTDDHDLYGVVDFYESYRAYVRGKVNTILEADASASHAARARAAAQARKYFLLSEACTREPLDKPKLYVVFGMIASGKSAVARELAALNNAPIVEADRVRKHGQGVAPETPWHDGAFSGHYGHEQTQTVYAELLRRAEVVLGSGRSVILDASFRAREQRGAALALAVRLGVKVWFLQCSAPEELCRERLAERARGQGVSDGRLEIFEAFARNFERADELGAEQLRRIDTTAPLAETQRRLQAFI